jgi:hypothetical protein
MIHVRGIRYRFADTPYLSSLKQVAPILASEARKSINQQVRQYEASVECELELDQSLGCDFDMDSKKVSKLTRCEIWHILCQFEFSHFDGRNAFA